MNWFNSRRARLLGALVPVLLPAVGGGCVSASLASNTGPRLVGQQWSTAPHQLAHVGENVHFDFVLTGVSGALISPIGIADYCVAYIGGDRLEVEFDPNGHVQFEYLFDAAAPGEAVKVTADAYRQIGGRDFMKVQGQWMQSASPYDVADRRVAGDSLTLDFYQAEIDLALPRPADDLEPETGVLRIRRADGSTTAIYIDRPTRPGFVLSGPDGSGFYHIHDSPTGTQLNPTGTTEVEFVVFDLSGQRHRVTTELPTP